MNDSDYCDKVGNICCTLGFQGFVLSLLHSLLLIHTPIFILFYPIFSFALCASHSQRFLITLLLCSTPWACYYISQLHSLCSTC